MKDLFVTMRRRKDIVHPFRLTVQFKAKCTEIRAISINRAFKITEFFHTRKGKSDAMMTIARKVISLT